MCHCIAESVVYFEEAVYRIEEGVSRLEVPVHRGGDLSQDLEVICYTRDGKV